MGALRDSFPRLPDALEALTGLAERDRSAELGTLIDSFDLLGDLAKELQAGLSERPPVSLADGDVIRPGFDAESR